MRDIDQLCVQPDDAVRFAIGRMDAGRCGIVLVTDRDRRLVGTITDGDVRRALLAQQPMETSVTTFLEAKSKLWAPPTPVTAQMSATKQTLLALMTSQSVRQIALLDGDGRVVDLATVEDFLPRPTPFASAVIMAGGRGTRMLPLTADVPKPMLPLGGRPLLEHIIEQLRQVGIRHVNVSTHYKPERIVDHFGDGQAFGVELTYVNEDRPLGTAGGLGLMVPPDNTQLVVNGDILTDVDFHAMLAFHQDNGGEMTVGVRRHEVQLPYGVIDCEAFRITGIREKPTLGFLVNAGIYLLEPAVYQFIPKGESFNMTELIGRLLERGRNVVSFPIREYWIDVGHHNDYARAEDDIQNKRVAR